MVTCGPGEAQGGEGSNATKPDRARHRAVAAAPQLVQANATISFNISPQDLNGGVLAFADKAGIQVFYDAARLSGLRTAGVAGTYTVEDALKILLAGTGVTYRFTAPNAVTLERNTSGTPGVTQLEPVVVLGARERETATSPVQGYVATRSATGTKTDTPLIETPRSVSVITRDQIEARNAQSLPQAVRYTAGVTIEGYGFDPRFDQIFIRGFPVNTTGDYRDNLWQTPGSFAYFRTEPYGLERIEVLKGPVSVLYGQATPGGLINRVTKRPLETPLREIEVQAGNYDRYQGAFDLSGPVDKEGRLLYRLTGVARDADTQGDAQDNRLFFAPAVTWKPKDRTSLTLLAQIQQDETDTSFFYFQPGGVLTKTRLSDPDYDELKQTQYQAGYIFEHGFDDTWTVRQNFRYGKIELQSRYLNPAGAAVGTVVPRMAVGLSEDLETVVVDNQLQVDFATGGIQHKVIGGLDYRWVEYDQGIGFGAAPSIDVANPVYGVWTPTPAITSHNGASMSATGVYVQDQLKFDRWRLQLGGRYDWVDRKSEDLTAGTTTAEKDDKAFTGQAGLLYLFDNGIAPYVSYSTSFVPTTSVDINGKLLNPSKGEQYEVGVKYQPPGQRSSITGALYQLTQKDATRPVPPTNAFFVQTGEVRVRGFELEALANLAAGLDLIATYTFNDAEVTKSVNPSELGKDPIVTPRHTASLWADYTVQAGDLSGLGFGAGTRYIGRNYSDTENTQTNKAKTLVDAALHYDLPSGWRFAVNAANLFDKEVATCNDGFCYWSVGRTVIGRVRYRW